MLNWLKQRKINSLLREIAYDKAFIKEILKCGEASGYHAANLAKNYEKLRQLGYKEQNNG